MRVLVIDRELFICRRKLDPQLRFYLISTNDTMHTATGRKNHTCHNKPLNSLWQTTSWNLCGGGTPTNSFLAPFKVEISIFPLPKLKAPKHLKRERLMFRFDFIFILVFIGLLIRRTIIEEINCSFLLSHHSAGITAHTYWLEHRLLCGTCAARFLVIRDASSADFCILLTALLHIVLKAQLVVESMITVP